MSHRKEASTDGAFVYAVKVALLAMEVSEAALRTLASTSAALDTQEQRITPLVEARDAVQAVQPETPQLLPNVHTLWAPLVQALKVTCWPSACGWFLESPYLWNMKKPLAGTSLIQEAVAGS